MKYLFLIVLLGCSGYSEYVKAPSYPNINEYCIDSVIYLHLIDLTNTAITVKWNKDSEVATCESEGKINEW